MSITDSSYQRVPLDFDEYLQLEHAKPAGRRRCDACCRDDLQCFELGRAGLNRSVDCEACIRARHAGDWHEQQIIFTMVDGMVAGAIEAAAPGSVPGEHAFALVRAAVDAALAAAERRSVEQLEAMFAAQDS